MPVKPGSDLRFYGGNRYEKNKVNPGVCGLESVITADGDGETDITVTIETKCAHVRKMIAALEQPVDAYEACFVKPGQGPVYEAAVNLAHGACPVPAAVLKCIEAEAGLALPRGVSFEFTD